MSPALGKPIRLSMTSAAVLSFGVIGIAEEDAISECPPRRRRATAAVTLTAEGDGLEICSFPVA